MKKIVIAIAALTGAIVISSPVASFADDYVGALDANTSAPGGQRAYDSPDTGQAPGTVGTVTLDGTLAAEEGDIIPASVLTRSVTVGADGSLHFSIKLPASAAPGTTYQLNVQAGTFADSQSIVIVGQPMDAGGPDDELSYTGTEAWPVLLGGGALLVAGLAMTGLVMARRRKQQGGDA
jgi:hypothetical protein